jgi:RecA/RadA recombinase
VPISQALAIALTPATFPLTRGIVRGIPERLRRARLPISIAPLDALFGGGLPCGAITELCGRQSSGRTALAHALVADVLAAGECAAWVDLPNALERYASRCRMRRIERVR